MFNFTHHVQTDMHVSCWLFHSHYINETKKEKPRRVIAKVRFHLYVWWKVLVSTPSFFHLSQTFRYHNIHWTHCFVSCAPWDTFWKIAQRRFTDGSQKNLGVLRKNAIYSGKIVTKTFWSSGITAYQSTKPQTDQAQTCGIMSLFNAAMR